MSACLDGYAQWLLLGGEASPEGFGGGAQSRPSSITSPLCVSMTQVGVFVAQVQSGCHLQLRSATIHGGPILLPILGVRARRISADPQGTAYLGGRPSHLIFRVRKFGQGTALFEASVLDLVVDEAEDADDVG